MATLNVSYYNPRSIYSVLEDITNFPDSWNNCNLQNMSILEAIERVLSDSGVQAWKINMLSLRRYHRVKFRFRRTINCFIDYMKIIADHKENETYPHHKLYIMRRIMSDITNWMIERRTYCADDSKWPIDEEHIKHYRSVYSAFPNWIDRSFMLIDSYFSTVLEQKRLVHDAFSCDMPTGEDVTEVEMYVDGNLVPPPLTNDCNILYTTV